MSLYQSILTLLFFQLVVSSSRILTADRGCPTSKGNQGARAPSQRRRPTGLSATALATGEPCGVFTLSCAPGLRCTPPEGNPCPLHALLEGRGICSNVSRINATERSQTVDTTPSGNLPVDTAPCRRLQIRILEVLDTQLIQSDRQIYLPNCDTQGFFKNKQCWSSRGKQRGSCWYVDQNGKPVPSPARQEGTLVYDSA